MKEWRRNNGVVGTDDKVINLFHGKRGKTRPSSIEAPANIILHSLQVVTLKIIYILQELRDEADEVVKLNHRWFSYNRDDSLKMLDAL